MYKVIILLILVAGTPLAFAHHGQTRPYEEQQCWWGYGYEPCYDRDHDNLPDDLDKCPDAWTHDLNFNEGCPYPTPIENPITVEIEYEGPEWILILVEWNEQKIIDDHTYDIALTWLFNHNILKIKQ